VIAMRWRHDNVDWLNRSQVNWRDGVLAPHTLARLLPDSRRRRLRLIVSPRTLMRWHATLVRRHWTQGRGHRSGTPAVRADLARVLQAQAKTILAADFFHVGTVFLRRLHVLFFIEHEWVTQQARSLPMSLEGRAVGTSARVTVVSGSPGSGKTVLMRSWISEPGVAGSAA
jgi:hypothetical protein